MKSWSKKIKLKEYQASTDNFFNNTILNLKEKNFLSVKG